MSLDQVALDGLTNAYTRYFDVVRADTPALLDEAYRLRYQVYCVENPFENPVEHQDGRETDVDDDRSVHCLLIYRPTGITAGTARVILPMDGAALRPLPIEHVVGSDPDLFSKLILGRTGEISRFSVSKEFRRRVGEERYADVGMTDRSTRVNERRLIPYITYGLIRGVLEICWDYEIDHICAVMEPAFIRLLARIGLNFETIGDLVNYHGLRQPCVARLADLVERSRRERALLWRCTGEQVLAAPVEVTSRGRQPALQWA